ncbi:MAG: sulfite exporter TauE/SafE family protein [Gemmatimonadaceae bacterium]
MTIVFLAIGLLGGVLSGMFGIGGGIVIVPSLMYFADMHIKRAVGTSLGALLLPVGILGVWSYYKVGEIDIRASLLIATGLAIGVYFGSLITQNADPNILRRGFAVFLCAVAVKVWVG